MPQEIIKNGVSSKDNLSNHEQLRVTQQIKAELNKLQSEVTNSITAEKFYEIKEDGNVHYHMDLVKQYLTTIKDKEWKDLKAENSSAWIMAVQIGLESLGKEEYDVGRIDGILRSKNQTESNTMKAIKKFQKDHGLTEDGLPGTKTINALLQAMNTNNTDTHNTDNNADNNNNANNNNADANNNTDTHNNNIDLEKIQEFTNKLERDNHALYVENEHFKKLQGPYTTPDSITIIPGDLDTYIPSVNDIQKRIKTISDLPNMINLARENDTKIQQYKTSLTQMGCTVEGTSIKKNGKEIGNLTRDLQTFNEADYNFNLLGKTLIKDYNEYQTEFGADSAKQQAKLEELLGILGMSLEKSTGKITDKKAQEVGTITLIHQEGVDNISEQEKKLSEAENAIKDNIKKVDKIIEDNIAILQDSTKTEEEKTQAIQTIIDHNNFNYVKKITSGLPDEVKTSYNRNYRRGIQGSTPAPLQLSLSCGDKHTKLPEIPYKGEQWDKVGKFLIENFSEKNKNKQFQTEEEFKKAETQCIETLGKFDMRYEKGGKVLNKEGTQIGGIPFIWNKPDTNEQINENIDFTEIDKIIKEQLEASCKTYNSAYNSLIGLNNITGNETYDNYGHTIMPPIDQTHIKDARRVALEKVEDIQYQQNVLNIQKNRYNTNLNQLKSLLTQKELTLNDKGEILKNGVSTGKKIPQFQEKDTNLPFNATAKRLTGTQEFYFKHPEGLTAAEKKKINIDTFNNLNALGWKVTSDRLQRKATHSKSNETFTFHLLEENTKDVVNENLDYKDLDTEIQNLKHTSYFYIYDKTISTCKNDIEHTIDGDIGPLVPINKNNIQDIRLRQAQKIHQIQENRNRMKERKTNRNIILTNIKDKGYTINTNGKIFKDGEDTGREIPKIDMNFPFYKIAKRIVDGQNWYYNNKSGISSEQATTINEQTYKMLTNLGWDVDKEKGTATHKATNQTLTFQKL